MPVLESANQLEVSRENGYDDDYCYCIFYLGAVFDLN